MRAFESALRPRPPLPGFHRPIPSDNGFLSTLVICHPARNPKFVFVPFLPASQANTLPCLRSVYEKLSGCLFWNSSGMCAFVIVFCLKLLCILLLALPLSFLSFCNLFCSSASFFHLKTLRAGAMPQSRSAPSTSASLTGRSATCTGGFLSPRPGAAADAADALPPPLPPLAFPRPAGSSAVLPRPPMVCQSCTRPWSGARTLAWSGLSGQKSTLVCVLEFWTAKTVPAATSASTSSRAPR
mmetsp:Transcript_14721/g.37435  ORF Transcript_14721/g.37435 Transcript_14721/m.37435 type:complete len:241 (+) Transcript_14721:29-751(+)